MKIIIKNYYPEGGITYGPELTFDTYREAIAYLMEEQTMQAMDRAEGIEEVALMGN